MKEKLSYLIEPKSIAVIGASGDVTRPSGRPIKYLKDNGYQGEVYPINPKYEEIVGFKCYPSISAIKKPIELAIISLPAKNAVDALEECGKNGVKAVVMFSSGFSEMGESAKDLQERLLNIVAKYDIQLCGPNCLGIINFKSVMTATYLTALEIGGLLRGNIGFVSQSGALAGYVYNWARDLGLGFSYWIATGNEATLGFPDFVDYLIEDEETSVITGYIENVQNAEKFTKVAEQALKKRKPIVIIKVGKSSAGSKAALSHTGALTGSDEVFESVFRQLGITRADSLEELLDYSSVFLMKRYASGKGVGIVSVSGGAGVIIADKSSEMGLQVPEINENLKQELREVLPEFASKNNPIDLTGQIISNPGMVGSCLEVLCKDENIDVMVFFIGLMHGIKKPVVDSLLKAYANTSKPLLVTWAGGPEDEVARLRDAGIPVFEDPTRCAKAVKVLVDYSQSLKKFEQANKQPIEIILDKTNLNVNKKTQALVEYEGKKLLAAQGIPVVKGYLAISENETIEAARKIGLPVVMKLQSKVLLHKTEANAVRLNLRNEEEIKRAYQELLMITKERSIEFEGILVEQMAKGIEVIVGLKKDPIFGSVIMVGMGGIFTEVYKDTALRVGSVDKEEALKMISEIKGYKIMTGFRGKPACDIDSLAEIIAKISQLPNIVKISELDLNPVMVDVKGDGAKVVDALVITEKD